MATIADILSSKWPGSEWRLRGDDYDSLEWISKTEKPAERDIRAFSDEVDVEIAQREKLVRQQKEFMNTSPDAILKTLNLLARAVVELREQVKTLSAGAVLTNADRVDQLVDSISAIKARG